MFTARFARDAENAEKTKFEVSREIPRNLKLLIRLRRSFMVVGTGFSKASGTQVDLESH
jgi:hypothetical protein